EVRFHARGSFRFHDEWYYFRLLNGVEVPGSDALPTEGLELAHVDDVYRWAREQPSLPYGMRFVAVGERLECDEFYQLAHRASPKRFAAVEILHEADDAGSMRYVWRGSYRDPMSATDVATI